MRRAKTVGRAGQHLNSLHNGTFFLASLSEAFQYPITTPHRFGKVIITVPALPGFAKAIYATIYTCSVESDQLCNVVVHQRRERAAINFTQRIQ